ncbi:MAG: CsgG/HfaB family protein [Nitrospirota bacterium]
MGAKRTGLTSSLVLLSLGLALGACAGKKVPPSSSALPSSVSLPRATSSQSPAARFPSSLVLSVLYFDDRTRTADLAWLRKGLPDMLVAELARVPNVMVVQRERLEEVVREQAFQLSGRVADESAVRIGRLAGATVLVTGSVTLAEGLLRMDAQLLGVEEGTVLGVAGAEGRPDEVSTVARSLVGKVIELIPAAGERRTVATGPDQSFAPAAKANDAGETLSREGKLFQALEEFERALAVDPAHPAAKSNYARTVRGLSGAELVGADQAPADDRRIVARVVERILGSGLEVEVKQVRTERARDGSATVVVPVRLRLNPSTLDAVVDSAKTLGGTVQSGQGQTETLDVALSSRAELNREFARALESPRRIFLRLISAEGRTIGVFSRLKDWQLSNWVLPVEDRLRFERGKVLDTEAPFASLSLSQMGSLAGVKVTVDPVSRERATLRLEASDVRDEAPERRRPLLLGERPRGEVAESEPIHPRGSGPDPMDLQEIKDLRSVMEQAWNPPITERSWGRGYLPSNERTAVVLTTVGIGDRQVKEEPRLLRPSGDQGFDQAALAAVKFGLQQWKEARVSGVGSAGAASVGDSPAQAGSGVPNRLKLRIQFRLVKDVPALNFIGPLGSEDQKGLSLGPGSPGRFPD